MKDFNLIATTSRGNEGRARSELCHLLEQVGDSAPTVERTGISGVITAKTVFNPFDVIAKLRDLLNERPYEFRYVLRVMPVEKVVPTEISQIQCAVNELSSKIGEDESFRITVEKRFTTISTKEVIEKTAQGIKRKVNLTKPDKILLIEIVGGATGLSVAEPNDILSVLKEKVL